MSDGEVDIDGEVPEGWRLQPFEELVQNHDGKRVPVKAADRADRQGKYPYYGASGIIDQVEDFLFDGDYLLIAEDGANLLSRSTPIAFQAHGRFWVNNHAHVVQPQYGAPLGYLEAFLNSIDLAPYVTGTAQPKLTQKALNRIDVPVAPVPEQRRIVAKLESLQARSRRAREALEAVPPLLEKLRQSILAAAFRGDLTADWRAQHLDVEPASERHDGSIERARPNENHVQNRAWHPGTKNAEDHCAPDESLIPETWRWSTLSRLTQIIDPNPTHRYPDYSGGSIPIISTQECRGLDDWDLSKAKLTSEAYWARQNATCRFSANDIVFARKGRLGLARRLPAVDKFTFSHTVFVVKTHQGMSSDYILWHLRSSWTLAWLIQAMNSNSGVPTLGKATTEQLPVPLPPLLEQTVIAQRISSLFSRVGALEAVLSRECEDSIRLDSAILSKAFRGELVPQDPNDAIAPLPDAPTTKSVSAPPQTKRTGKGAHPLAEAHGRNSRGR